MKVAQLQMNVTDNKEANIRTVCDWSQGISHQGIDLICLPEMFNCPYETTAFPEYAEPEKGETWTFLSDLARTNKFYVVGGSVAEIDNDRYYNTCYVFDPTGSQIGKHRKMHLFDIDIAGGQRFMESDILSSGNKLTVVDTKFGRIGVAICYDIRFPELLRLMVLDGAEYIFIPAAFNLTTGPAHWEILFRTRALDNQVYLFGTSSARNAEASYQSYGHSIFVSPWGEVLDELDEKEGWMINTLDNKRLKEIRDQLPLLKHRRTDVYDLSLSS